MYTCYRAGKYVGAVLGAARVQYLSNTKMHISQKKHDKREYGTYRDHQNMAIIALFTEQNLCKLVKYGTK